MLILTFKCVDVKKIRFEFIHVYTYVLYVIGISSAYVPVKIYFVTYQHRVRVKVIDSCW